jgi:uncharacterized membrane protein YdjX (TVP38/TMEM64 family)
MTDQNMPIGARRLLAPAVVVALLAAGYALGWHRYFTLESLVQHREMLASFTASHHVLSIALFAAVYIVAVAISFPGASILTVLAGLLFGWLEGAIIAMVSATLGATIVFQIAKSAFGDVLAQKAGPFLKRFRDGFSEDAFNYLLFLRLVPAFPFWVVNIAPALANVKLRTFVVTTILGIIPGSFAFASVGSGLNSIIETHQAAHAQCVATKSLAECPFELTTSSLVTPQLIAGFVALGVVALIPVALKKWKARRAL